MELDKRIKDIDTIQTILRYDVNCIGCEGYFFDEFVDTKDLSLCCCYGELIEIDFGRDQNDLCFKAKLKNGNINYFRFFISEDDLKPVEKKYRPFSLNEFLNEHEIGDKITYRTVRFKKSVEEQEPFIRNKAMICGYQIMEGEANTPGKGLINLGGIWVSLQVMFDDYETPNSYLYPEVWEPFGVLDKENE